MTKHITSGIFKNFIESKKLAWWEYNSPDIYKKIKEEQNGNTFDDISREMLYSFIENNILGGNAYSITKNNSTTDYNELYKSTLNAMENKNKLIKDGVIFINNRIYKFNFALYDENKGNYNIFNIKNNSNIWKGLKTKVELEKGIKYELSYNYYGYKKGLQTLFSGNMFVFYLNKNYRLTGNGIDAGLFNLDMFNNELKSSITDMSTLPLKEINAYFPNDFIINQNGYISQNQSITNNGENHQLLLNNREPYIGMGYNNTFILTNTKGENILNRFYGTTAGLFYETEIEGAINEMESTLNGSASNIEWNGTKYLEFFGKNPDEGTVFDIPNISGKQALKASLAGYNSINDVPDNFFEKSAEIYRQKWKKGNHIDLRGLAEQLNCLNGKILYFYDYETISIPVPFLEKTGPNQQVVVQYSLHKLYPNGTLEHYEGIVDETQKDTLHLVKKMYNDFNVQDFTQCKFIVWNKTFENTRNKEMGEMFPEYASFFEQINKNTYDLADIFHPIKGVYFDTRTNGSYSIKKVLPLLSNLSYNGMNIPNGAIASEALLGLYRNNYNENIETKRNLLEYCKLDTYAMVEIYWKLIDILNNNSGDILKF